MEKPSEGNNENNPQTATHSQKENKLTLYKVDSNNIYVRHDFEENNHISGNIDDKDSQKIVYDDTYYIIKLKKRFKSWEYLQSSSNVHSIISIIICLFSLAVGIFLYIAEKNNMMSEVRSIVSTSIFGTGSLTTLLGSLFALKNVLYKNRLDTLDVLYEKENKVPGRKIQWVVKSRIDHVKMIVNYENELISEFLEEAKDIFRKMKDMHASNFMAEIAKCYKIRNMKFINGLLNELSNFINPSNGDINIMINKKKEIKNDLNDEHDEIAKQTKLIENARNVLNDKHDEHMDKYKTENQTLIDTLKIIVMNHAEQIGDTKASKEIYNIANELKDIKLMSARTYKKKVIKLINMFLNIEEKIANEQMKIMNASNKMVEIITNYKNEDMTLINILYSFAKQNISANCNKIVEDIKENADIKDDETCKKEENQDEDKTVKKDIKVNMKEIDDETCKKEEDKDGIVEEYTKKNAGKKKDKKTCNKEEDEEKKDKETCNKEENEGEITKDTKENTNESDTIDNFIYFFEYVIIIIKFKIIKSKLSKISKKRPIFEKYEQFDRKQLYFIKKLVNHTRYMFILRSIWVAIFSFIFITLAAKAIFMLLNENDRNIFKIVVIVLISISILCLYGTISVIILTKVIIPKILGD
ncbi:8422_t:CDS:2 [Scutellospora calospora]|uniref:8422_t:CDS:1 n=1 Tax=Scutellospora calospora TaxID=85575 RepID=A0ACA9KG45_9GLOM|nr:8422_t:CDS:2 [Scutellospora calospora]